MNTNNPLYSQVCEQEKALLQALEAVRAYKRVLEENPVIASILAPQEKPYSVLPNDLSLIKNTYNKFWTAKDKIKFVLKNYGNNKTTSEIIELIAKLEKVDKSSVTSSIHNALSKNQGELFTRIDGPNGFIYSLI